ncbi:F-box protein [Endozoicomonas sp. ONNA2]|uniref:F-box protein n=1 Tax=Endozoicomonas sp. ONNA2 TaxID=2828741 RepID=UPI0021479B68|nr:F-box protein [Endozoicomonas sp. ONNA2]
MSNPLSAAATGFPVVPDWPENQPAKTTRSNSPSTAATAQALSVQTQPAQTQPLRQRRITELLPELLVLIFDYLEFDDIRRVNATCLAFRDVVKENNYIQELSYFARLPRSFREQYQQTAPWQKKIQEWHPFAKSAPLNGRRMSFRDRVIKNLPQMTALLCLGTLGKMEQCPFYRPVKRYKVTIPQSQAWVPYIHTDKTFDVCCGLSSNHLLIHGSFLSDSQMLARDDRGQWAEEHLNWSDNSRSRVIAGATFSACKNHLLTWNTDGNVYTLRPAHHGWDEVARLYLSSMSVRFSPSGKYMVNWRGHDPIIVWRMDENSHWQKMKVTGLAPGVVIMKALFSPSERHLLLRTPRRVTMLSLNDRGVWSGRQLPLSNERREHIAHASLSQVSDQVLVCIRGNHPGRVAIHSPEPSGRWQETTILMDFFQLDFSPAGNYLFTKSDPEDLQRSPYVLLWCRPEKWSDWSLDSLSEEEANNAALTRLKSAIRLKHDSPVLMALFSQSDSHLVVSTQFGGICIWGKNQAGTWSIQTITREYAPCTIPGISLSGLHVLTCKPSSVGILGCSDQKRWSLKGVIKQDGIVKACFNPISEHEVMVLSRNMDDDSRSYTLTVWEMRDPGTPD